MKALKGGQRAAVAGLGHGERKRRIALAAGALCATLVAAVLVLELVGTFSGAVPLPSAVVIVQSHQQPGATVGSGRGQRFPTEPAAAIVRSVPKVIEGGDANDETSTTARAGETDSSSTTSTTVDSQATVPTTTAPPKRSTGEDGGGSDTAHHSIGTVTTTRTSKTSRPGASDDGHNANSDDSHSSGSDDTSPTKSGDSASTFGSSGSRKHTAGSDGASANRTDK